MNTKHTSLYVRCKFKITFVVDKEQVIGIWQYNIMIADSNNNGDMKEVTVKTLNCFTFFSDITN